MVIWLIGLAGAGKTSIGRALYRSIRARDPATVFLDGDQVREAFGNDLGFSLEDRRVNGWRICRICALLDAQSINVVCATLSQFHDQQSWNRATMRQYFEVFIDVSMNTLIKRDQKGLYSGARSGSIENVVGVDMPFPRPIAPDLILDNDRENGDFAMLSADILAAISKRFAGWPEVPTP